VFGYGSASDIPVVGDWRAFGPDFIDTAAVFQNGQWLLRNVNSSGGPQFVVSFGTSGDIPVATKQHCAPPDTTTTTNSFSSSQPRGD
jgi:hypothetical protein